MIRRLLIPQFFLTILLPLNLAAGAQPGDECNEVFSSSIVAKDGETYVDTSLWGRWRGLGFRHGVVSVPISDNKRIEVDMPPEIAELIRSGYFLFYGKGRSLRFSLNGNTQRVAAFDLDKETKRVRFSRFHNGSLKIEIEDDDGERQVLEVPVNERLNEDNGKVLFAGEHESTTAIRKRKKFWKRSVEDVEARLRLMKYLPFGQSLIRILARDNETVVNRYGTSHKEISKLLKVLIEQKPGTFVYRGVPFTVRTGLYRTWWDNPKDGTNTSTMHDVINRDTGKMISFPDFFPDLVKDGFYGGYGSRDRISPETIIEVLSFLKSQ